MSRTASHDGEREEVDERNRLSGGADGAEIAFGEFRGADAPEDVRVEGATAETARSPARPNAPFGESIPLTSFGLGTPQHAMVPPSLLSEFATQTQSLGGGTLYHWPLAVWVALLEPKSPLMWQEAQRIASVKCRELSVPYGRDSVERTNRFQSLMEEVYGPSWLAAARVGARHRTELARAQLEARVAESRIHEAEQRAILGLPISPDEVPTTTRLTAEALAGADAGMEALAATTAVPTSPVQRADFEGLESVRSFGASTQAVVTNVREGYFEFHGGVDAESLSQLDTRMHAEM